MSFYKIIDFNFDSDKENSYTEEYKNVIKTLVLGKIVIIEDDEDDEDYWEEDIADKLNSYIKSIIGMDVRFIKYENIKSFDREKIMTTLGDQLTDYQMVDLVNQYSLILHYYSGS